MKVVLFCGGQGVALHPLIPEPSKYWPQGPNDLPKPMVCIGGRHPMLWHVMKYYAHFGHRDFVLCLGHRGEMIKDYFLRYNEYLTNDFLFAQGGKSLDLFHRDISDWDITFVDTGLHTCVGGRLKAVQKYMSDEDIFIADYTDSLSDLPLDQYIEHFLQTDYVGAFLCVRPPHTSQIVQFSEDGNVSDVQPMDESGVWINGGYYLFRKAIFDYINDNEELVRGPMQRLIAEGKLLGFRYDGFWTCIDTFREKQRLDEMYARGDAPWQVWYERGKAGQPDNGGARIQEAPAPAEAIQPAPAPQDMV